MTTPTGTTPPTTTAAWQSALAAEHAAVFGYSALGPRLGAADAIVARSNQAAHRALRDSSESALAALGVTPVPARADYPAPTPLSTAAQAQQFALQLESACAAAWRYLLAAAATAPGSEPTVRAVAQAGLTASAVRAAGLAATDRPEPPERCLSRYLNSASQARTAWANVNRLSGS